ncbi:MAG: hypothetical protein Q7Q73_14065 [Verrucomicrobiota bacterium JB024]|nr:hypothetical protein [Verrucomicrobiota bacterium JB024]
MHIKSVSKELFNRAGVLKAALLLGAAACVSAEEQRDKTKPFFPMVCHKAPHGPFKYADRHEHALDGVEIPEPASLWEDQSHRSEGVARAGAFYREICRTRRGSQLSDR